MEDLGLIHIHGLEPLVIIELGVLCDGAHSVHLLVESVHNGGAEHILQSLDRQLLVGAVGGNGQGVRRDPGGLDAGGACQAGHYFPIDAGLGGLLGAAGVANVHRQLALLEEALGVVHSSDRLVKDPLVLQALQELQRLQAAGIVDGGHAVLIQEALAGLPVVGQEADHQNALAGAAPILEEGLHIGHLLLDRQAVLDQFIPCLRRAVKTGLVENIHIAVHHTGVAHQHRRNILLAHDLPQIPIEVIIDLLFREIAVQRLERAGFHQVIGLIDVHDVRPFVRDQAGRHLLLVAIPGEDDHLDRAVVLLFKGVKLLIPEHLVRQFRVGLGVRRDPHPDGLPAGITGRGASSGGVSIAAVAAARQDTQDHYHTQDNSQ